MEFDYGCYAGGYGEYKYGYGRTTGGDMETLFETLTREFNDNGYTMPKLVFWNVNSRTNTIPLKQNKAGVVLVSGFSPAVVKMVLSDKTDPYEALLEQLNTERYQPVEDAVKGIVA